MATTAKPAPVHYVMTADTGKVSGVFATVIHENMITSNPPTLPEIESILEVYTDNLIPKS